MRKKFDYTKCPEASWRKMLIIQPPVRSYRYNWHMMAIDLSGQVQAQQNITVGDVVDKWTEESNNANRPEPRVASRTASREAKKGTIDFTTHYTELMTSDLLCLSDKLQAHQVDMELFPPDENVASV